MTDWTDWTETGEDAGDQARRARRRATVREIRLDEAVRALAASPDGALVLRWIMDECGVVRAACPTDARLMLWQEGRRSVGMQILERCAAVGQAAMLFQKEEDHD